MTTKYLKAIKKQKHILCFFFILSLQAQASISTDWLLTNLQPWSASQESVVLNDFAESEQKFCAMFTPQAFKKHSDLQSSCQFPILYKKYLSKLKSLYSGEQVGLIIADSDIEDSQIPALQSGSWQKFLFADANASETAAQIITLRFGLEKSLKSHAHYIRRTQDQGYLNGYAAFVVPRMMASFSAYSQTLRLLTIVNNFECGNEKVLACGELKQVLGAIRGEILSGIGADDFLASLKELNEETSTRNSLKARDAADIVQLLALMKKEMDVDDILNSVNERKPHPRYQELIALLDKMSIDGVVAGGNKDFPNMLMAISILSEIQQAQDLSHLKSSTQSSKFSHYLKQTDQEIKVLKSYVLNVFTQESIK